ncbi:MAG: JAB domain-containing protein [Ruminococcus sp.]
MTAKAKNIHEGHRQRLRKRFAENGLNGFHPHEILELILFYSIPRANTNETAHNLINHFGSVYNVFKASPEELSAVNGIGSKSAELIKLFGDVCFYYLENENTGEKPSDIKEYVNNYFAESDCGMFLTVFMGADMTVKSNYTFTPEDFRCHEKIISSLTMTALKNNASNIIIARNCGKGKIPVPQNEDYFAVRLIAESLKSLGIHTADYIISNGSEAFSMFEEGVFGF